MESTIPRAQISAGFTQATDLRVLLYAVVAQHKNIWSTSFDDEILLRLGDEQHFDMDQNQQLLIHGMHCYEDWRDYSWMASLVLSSVHVDECSLSYSH